MNDFFTGSGECGGLKILDVITIMNFAIGMQNLSMNIMQEDLGKRLDEILRRLENDGKRDLQKRSEAHD